MNATATSILRVERVSKRFEARRVLEDVSLELGAGQILLILGANGSGKTTLMSIIAGRLKPDAGSVSVCGCSLNKEAEGARARTGLVAHEPMLHLGLSVWENLHWFAQAQGVVDAKARTREVIEMMALGACSDQKAGLLSRGQLQRAALARAILTKPPLLLLDEPFTSLDEAARMALKAAIAAQRESGNAAILTTHETAVGLECATHVVTLKDARLGQADKLP